MGLLSWFKGSPQPQQPKPVSESESKPKQPTTTQSPAEVPGMNGAVEVPRRLADVTVFEFGSVTASADKVTLAGFCTVSDDLEPCRWEILPASSSDAPQFRIVFWVRDRETLFIICKLAQNIKRPHCWVCLFVRFSYLKFETELWI